MINLDISTNKSHLLHWFVSNIPSNGTIDSDSTTTIPYLPPIPFYGTGFHRIAFIVFRHNNQIEFSDYFKKFELSGNGFFFKFI